MDKYGYLLLCCILGTLILLFGNHQYTESGYRMGNILSCETKGTIFPRNECQLSPGTILPSPTTTKDAWAFTYTRLMITPEQSQGCQYVFYKKRLLWNIFTADTGNVAAYMAPIDTTPISEEPVCAKNYYDSEIEGIIAGWVVKATCNGLFLTTFRITI